MATQAAHDRVRVVRAASLCSTSEHGTWTVLKHHTACRRLHEAYGVLYVHTCGCEPPAVPLRHPALISHDSTRRHGMGGGGGRPHAAQHARPGLTRTPPSGPGTADRRAGVWRSDGPRPQAVHLIRGDCGSASPVASRPTMPCHAGPGNVLICVGADPIVASSSPSHNRIATGGFARTLQHVWLGWRASSAAAATGQPACQAVHATRSPPCRDLVSQGKSPFEEHGFGILV